MTRDIPVSRCIYRYDALDRLANHSVEGEASVRFFYRKNRLTTHIQGHVKRSLLQTEEHLLAQKNQNVEHVEPVCLATDHQGSIIATPVQALAYTPYGLRHPSADQMNLPGFNGERIDPVTGHYLLGNGYRSFNPALMRFNSPDSLSPFGKGGLNAYAYCLGDPVNRKDPTGRGAVIPGLYDFLLNTVSRFKNPFQEPRNFAPLRLHNYRKDGALGLYDQVKKNGTISLVIDTHGDDPGPEGKPAIFVQEDLAVGPKRFARHVKKYDIARYKGIHLVACYSANLGEKSIAAVLAKQTGLPVKGYEGKVMVSELWNSVHQENRLEGIYKELPPYLYNPRTFYPDGTQSAIRKS